MQIPINICGDNRLPLLGNLYFPYSYCHFGSSEFVMIFFMKCSQDSRVQEISGCCFYLLSFGSLFRRGISSQTAEW